MAAALGALGSKAAWVVRGEDGLDEISPFGPTRVSTVIDGKVDELVVSPEDFGLPRSEPGAIDGGNAQTNSAILVDVLSGRPHPARNALVLNAAASLVLAKGLNRKSAASLAQQVIDSGRALECLGQWQRAARSALEAAPA
jgi:anthranilate phosphoribosyltransferase